MNVRVQKCTSLFAFFGRKRWLALLSKQGCVPLVRGGEQRVVARKGRRRKAYDWTLETGTVVRLLRRRAKPKKRCIQSLVNFNWTLLRNIFD